MNVEIINKIKTYIEYYSIDYPTIELNPDLSCFEKRKCGMSEFDFEMVHIFKGSSAIFYTGEIAFPLTNNRFIIIRYCE